MDGEGWRDEKTNSGEPILEMWVRKRGRHGATPLVEGGAEVVLIVRASRKRRELAWEAIVRDCGDEVKSLGFRSDFLYSESLLRREDMRLRQE